MLDYWKMLRVLVWDSDFFFAGSPPGGGVKSFPEPGSAAPGLECTPIKNKIGNLFSSVFSFYYYFKAYPGSFIFNEIPYQIYWINIYLIL